MEEYIKVIKNTNISFEIHNPELSNLFSKLDNMIIMYVNFGTNMIILENNYSIWRIENVDLSIISDDKKSVFIKKIIESDSEHKNELQTVFKFNVSDDMRFLKKNKNCSSIFIETKDETINLNLDRIKFKFNLEPIYKDINMCVYLSTNQYLERCGF